MSFVLTGIYCAKQVKQKVFILEKLSQLFSDFCFLASVGSRDVRSLCEEISVADKFSCFSFPKVFSASLYDGCDLCSVWGECVENAGELLCLNKEDRQTVKSFSQVFLSSGVDEFCDTCRKFSEKFKSAASKAQECSQQNQKIFISSSVLLAAAFFIVSF